MQQYSPVSEEVESFTLKPLPLPDDEEEYHDDGDQNGGKDELLPSHIGEEEELLRQRWAAPNDDGGLLTKPTRKNPYAHTPCSRWPMLSILLSFIAVATLLLAFAFSGRSSSSRRSFVLSSDSPYVYASSRPDLEPDEKHPIKLLMERATKEWDAKVARQSTSYRSAVAEYKRRYGRDPPKGFKDWYTFASQADVQLIDEYDSIMVSIEPLLALSPSVLRERIAALTTEREEPVHALIRVANRRQLPSLGGTWRPAVVDNWNELLEPIVKWLPDIELPVFLHDGAHTSLDWEARQGYLTAAGDGDIVDEDRLPISGETGYTIRDRECAPDSKFRQVRTGLELALPVAEGPGFINRHHAAMDFCNDPTFMQLHGAVSTVWDLGALYPSFSMSKQAFHGDILYPAGIHYDLNPETDVPFKEKDIHKVVWRGSLDGIDVHPNTDWRSSHRYRLVALATSKLSIPKTLRTTVSTLFSGEHQKDVDTTLKALNERYTNIRATGKALQCDPELCDILDKETDWAEFLSKEEMSRHRYVMDVDGNSYSARFRAHLLSNQVPMKSTIFAGWYSERIQPWLHYIPLRVDYADLYDIMAYFDGDLSRNGHHDDLAEGIALAGKDWAEKFWRPVDMQAYTFRLLLEYARLFDSARDAQRETEYKSQFP